MNSFDPSGAILRPFPKRISHKGHSVTLEPLTVGHVAELWDAVTDAAQSWTHLRYGPFPTIEDFETHVRDLATRDHQPFWAVRPRATARASGWLSLCDVFQADAALEIGSIWYSPNLQRTRAATEAVFLLMQYSFDELGYQRLVWRCLAQNEASHCAADMDSYPKACGAVPSNLREKGAISAGSQCCGPNGQPTKKPFAHG